MIIRTLLLQAATSEILSPVVREDKEAQMKILDRYFDPEICNKATVSPTSCMQGVVRTCISWSVYLFC